MLARIPAAAPASRPGPRHNGNLGATAQRPRSRSRDPMAAYDALPEPLRLWLAGAALPWSPASVLRLWRRLRAGGATPAQALAALDRAEAMALRREAPCP